MDKIIGQIIEERLKAKNMEVTEFAKLINRERTNVYNIFKRKSINTELLKKIGQILNYDFFIHFLEPETIEKIKISDVVKESKVFVEIPMNESEIVELGITEKIVKVINQKKNE
ncbi:helix-turn-helix domain-containing protein [Proteiniphilum sp.]|uniref:helix-turn-helix domain-containing protein n=1 Tax=Proteiniphilum sp. TaxID=1926877 RepID=UPI003331D7C1